MKKLFLVCSLVVVLISVMTFNARADLITGAISFSGTSVLDNIDYTLAKEFTAFSNVVVSGTGGTGDYSLALAGQSVTFTPFTFSPSLSPAPLNPLWTFDVAGNIYSFEATGLIINSSIPNSITMSGPGIASITGFDDTLGTWVISANKAGSTASFSASTEVIGVPEPATMLLLGLGLIGIAGFAKKRFRN
jgi:hypothetical protein